MPHVIQGCKEFEILNHPVYVIYKRDGKCCKEGNHSCDINFVLGMLLGYNLLMTGRAREAVPHLARAAEIVPWEPVYRRALAVAKERTPGE